jgi:hypothetical protein
LIVHAVCPGPRVFAALADRVADLVSVGVDRVGRDVADATRRHAHDIVQRARERLPSDDAAGQEDLVAPDAHLHLAVGARVRQVAFSHDRVCDLVAELVRVSRQHDFAHPNHDGNLESWV